jgi:macrolide-specific efflux system membrane fusion protein
MRNKKTKIIMVVSFFLLAAAIWQFKLKPAKVNGEVMKEVVPFKGTIQNVISTTGTVLPKNRLEVKPPVNGRIEELLVEEGAKVRAGQTLAWMSSTERAALLDAARGQGEEQLKYWKEVYKAIPLISPIDGEVIVATTQPGQTVTTSDPVVVLSDQLIVRAQADETDIGKVKLGQKALISLDAYPDTKIRAAVQHIYYESETVNNVTVYKVDLLPEEVPLFFRSGMNATIDFIIESKEDVLVIPLEAVQTENGDKFVWIKNKNGAEPQSRKVSLGLSDDKNAEIISGIDANEVVVIRAKKYSLPKSNSGTNPFMPARRRSTSAR